MRRADPLRSVRPAPRQLDVARYRPSVKKPIDGFSGVPMSIARSRIVLPSSQLVSGRRTHAWQAARLRLSVTKKRPLTHLEAALIQGFPLDYKWCGSKVQIARQIGNAVPTGLARAIAEVIYERLRSDVQPS